MIDQDLESHQATTQSSEAAAIEKTQQSPLKFSDKSTDSSLKLASAQQMAQEFTDEAQGLEQALTGSDAEELFMGTEETEVIEDIVEPAPVEKLSTMSLPAALCDEVLLKELSAIPSKMGFKIGEVAEMLGIKQYVLRYWETEFDVLKPKKAANNQRYYTKKDVENVFLIRKLLHRDRFSIEGARTALKELKNVVRKEKDWSQVNHRVDVLSDRVENLIGDLRRLKEAFI